MVVCGPVHQDSLVGELRVEFLDSIVEGFWE
jgi:hypothetical protein